MSFVIADRVKETTTSTGTGTLTLAGAMTGFQAFSAKCAVGDTLYYALQAVGDDGAPTGEWECGLGTYSAANTLTRTLVTASSNSDTVVTLSAGAKQVFITMPATQVAWMRERLSADRTYYVATTGSDGNDGLSSGAPFLTIQKAINVVAANLDLGTHNVTIQVADGTYAAANTLRRCVGSGGIVTIKGNQTTPANVIISATSSDCFTLNEPGTTWAVESLKMQTTTSGSGLYATNNSYLRYGNVVFGACVTYHLYASHGATIECTSNYSISGNAYSHFFSRFCGRIMAASKTVNLTTSITVTYFAYATFGGILSIGSNTYSGSAATGTKYLANYNGLISSGVTIPGNVAGSVSTGGQYA